MNLKMNLAVSSALCTYRMLTDMATAHILRLFLFMEVTSSENHMLFFQFPSYAILFHPVLSYPILSYSILSYPILSYPILSYDILFPLLDSFPNIRSISFLSFYCSYFLFNSLLNILFLSCFHSILYCCRLYFTFVLSPSLWLALVFAHVPCVFTFSYLLTI